MPLKQNLLKALEKDRELLEMERQLREQYSSNREVYKWGDPNNIPLSKIEKNPILKEQPEPFTIRPLSRRGKKEHQLEIPDQRYKLNPIKPLVACRSARNGTVDVNKQSDVGKEMENGQRSRSGCLFARNLQEDKQKLKELRREVPKKMEINSLREKSVYDVSSNKEKTNIFDDDLPDTNQLYRDYYNEQLLIIKSEKPNISLRESQDKIKKMWDVSTENPRNNV